MPEVQLSSGAKLDITIAPFEAADELQRALLKAAEGLPLDADIMSMDVTHLKDFVIRAAISPDVKRALAPCLLRCTYEGAKITKDLWDDPVLSERAREDYYSICMEVIKANCLPFFKQVFSKFKMPPKTEPIIQK